MISEILRQAKEVFERWWFSGHTTILLAPGSIFGNNFACLVIQIHFFENMAHGFQLSSRYAQVYFADTILLALFHSLLARRHFASDLPQLIYLILRQFALAHESFNFGFTLSNLFLGCFKVLFIWNFALLQIRLRRSCDFTFFVTFDILLTFYFVGRQGVAGPVNKFFIEGIVLESWNFLGKILYILDVVYFLMEPRVS